MIWLSDRSALSFDSIGRAQPTVGPPGSGAPILGWFVQAYIDDIHTLSRLARSKWCTCAGGSSAPQALCQGIQVGRSIVGLLGHVIFAIDVSIEPRKVAIVTESGQSATPTSFTDRPCFIRLWKLKTTGTTAICLSRASPRPR